MAFVKPYTYTTGAVLTAANQNLNDEAAKLYVNQQVVSGDISSNTIDTDDISRGEIEAISKSMRFETGNHYAAHNGIDPITRAYFTSHIKPRAQTSNSLLLFPPLWETGTEVSLEYEADILFDFGGTFISTENDIQSNAWWDSLVFLEMVNLANGDVTRYGVTRSYSFEEVEPDSSNPAPGGSVDPFGGNYIANTLGNDADTKFALRRWIGFRKVLSGLSPGRYLFRTVVNPKVEQGFASARNYTIEVFYKYQA